MTSEASLPRQPRKDTLETRRQMIDAAEALFAEHGVDNVTLLDIARAAGQGNRNAPQYHFGDKEGLINAVLDKHSDLISIRRQAMMAALLEKDSYTLRDLVEVFVLPVAMHVDTTANSLTYLLIHCQLMTSGAFVGLTQARTSRYPEVQQLAKLLHPMIATDSRTERDAKVLLIQTMLFHGLAAFHASGAKSSQRFIKILCDSIQAVLGR